MVARRILATAIGLVAAVSLVACSSPTPSGWQVTPLLHAPSGSPLFENHHVDQEDVPFSIASMKSDTAGGIWANSSDTWMHVDGTGKKLATFNEQRAVTSFVAETSATLIASVNADPGQRNTLFRFDTSGHRWSTLLSTASYLGDVARLRDGTIVYVAFPGGEPFPLAPQSYEIDSLSMTGARSVLVRPDLPATWVSIATDSTGTLFVRTETGGFDRLKDGTISVAPASTARTADEVGFPVLAANPHGDLLSDIADPSSAVRDWHVAGGSDDAQRILTNLPCCGTTAQLSLTRGTTTTRLPFTAGAVAAAWLDDSTFAYVMPGGGDASVIATVNIPK